MIRIGEYQTLKIARQMPQGFYLVCDDGKEVLMPRKYTTIDMKIGDMVKVFVYSDSKDLDVATTETPMFTVGQYATLMVADVNEVGAFCDWGVNKQLIIPFSNQYSKLKEGEKTVVYLYVDTKTDRLVGTTKIQKHVFHFAGPELEAGQEVELLIYAWTKLGYKVIINQKYGGLIYGTEINYKLEIGSKTKGYIKEIREDRKIDVTLFKKSENQFEESSSNIISLLNSNEGFLPFSDKSPPDVIRRQFGISKKQFKKIIGNLYRQKQIELKDGGIYLTKPTAKTPLVKEGD